MTLHTVSFQIFRSLSFMSVFLSNVVLENYFVKSQHSVLKLCHLPFFFWQKNLKIFFHLFLKIPEITTITSKLSSFNDSFPTSWIYWRPCLKRDHENGKWTKNLKTYSVRWIPVFIETPKIRLTSGPDFTTLDFVDGAPLILPLDHIRDWSDET